MQRRVLNSWNGFRIADARYSLPATRYCLGKLFQESQIVLVEIADVIDAVEEHREPLEAHAEGVAGPDFRIVAHGLEDRRIDHAAAADFDPLLLHLRQMRCAQIDFEARLGIAEVVRTETRLRLLAEQRRRCSRAAPSDRGP